MFMETGASGSLGLALLDARFLSNVQNRDLLEVSQAVVSLDRPLNGQEVVGNFLMGIQNNGLLGGRLRSLDNEWDWGRSWSRRSRRGGDEPLGSEFGDFIDGFGELQRSFLWDGLCSLFNRLLRDGLRLFLNSLGYDFVPEVPFGKPGEPIVDVRLHHPDAECPEGVEEFGVLSQAEIYFFYELLVDWLKTEVRVGWKIHNTNQGLI